MLVNVFVSMGSQMQLQTGRQEEKGRKGERRRWSWEGGRERHTHTHTQTLIHTRTQTLIHTRTQAHSCTDLVVKELGLKLHVDRKHECLPSTLLVDHHLSRLNRAHVQHLALVPALRQPENLPDAC